MFPLPSMKRWCTYLSQSDLQELNIIGCYPNTNAATGTAPLHMTSHLLTPPENTWRLDADGVGAAPASPRPAPPKGWLIQYHCLSEFVFELHSVERDGLICCVLTSGFFGP